MEINCLVFNELLWNKAVRLLLFCCFDAFVCIGPIVRVHGCVQLYSLWHRYIGDHGVKSLGTCFLNRPCNLLCNAVACLLLAEDSFIRCWYSTVPMMCCFMLGIDPPYFLEKYWSEILFVIWACEPPPYPTTTWFWFCRKHWFYLKNLTSSFFSLAKWNASCAWAEFGSHWVMGMSHSSMTQLKSSFQLS